MPYAEDRFVHDADNHLMEMSDCLNPYFEKTLRKRFLVQWITLVSLANFLQRLRQTKNSQKRPCTT